MPTATIPDRKLSIGGSDAAAILGLSRWKTPLQVYAEKLGQIENEIGNEEAVYWGNELEDIVAKEFQKRTGMKVRRYPYDIVHPKYDFITGHIDRKIEGSDELLECKTASAYKAKEWEGDEIPQEYIIQVLHYLAITGMKRAHLAVLIGGQKFIYKVVERDEAMIDRIISEEVEFWNAHVLEKSPPEVTGLDADTELLKKLFPKGDPGSKTTLDEYAVDLARRQHLDKELKRIELEIDEIDNRVKAAMQNYEVGTAGNFIVSWKNQDRTSLDTKRLKEEAPEMYDRYAQTKTIRVFSVKEAKEKK